MKEGATPKKPLGCDPNRSLLFAQVISGEPEMRIDVFKAPEGQN